MKRNEFLKLCGLLGISFPLQSVISSCSSSNTNSNNNPPESVIIIGAGPAGMAAGYLLAQQGINFQIIEANSSYGGRIKHNTAFSNFPISMGGEWIHVASSILPEIVNDASVTITTETQGYNNSDLVQEWDGNTITETTLGNIGGSQDLKFVGSSWLGFFETYVLPSIQNNIIYNTPITGIDYSSNDVIVTSSNGQTFTAEKVIVAVPVKILQNAVINFTPELPNNKQQAINNVEVWGGFKAFFKFTSKFYGAYLGLPDSETDQGQRIYYDAAYAQNTSDNILGLFSVGQQAEQYQNLSGNAQRDYILNELDTIFGNNIASNGYLDHIVQNWNAEPYAQAAYIRDQENWQLLRTLGQSVNNKLYFAGDAYTNGEDWSSVHTAVRSAKRAVEEMVS
ncbi:FAD-dependent oxidoreductase [Winogradskyella sp.]|uniref:flavin monoamine oxidase family protein n=1 Tax=Winogradskyella sp. TaxID=1883156 RepID=UPI00262D0E0C|nr:FAD-dependent oxidoreductase [Winogradskyella sp.]